jgi:hypothetical protein
MKNITINRISFLLILTAIFTFGAQAAAAQTAPRALVADLYKQHDAKRGPFFQSKSRARVDKYFSASLARLIWKEATRKNSNEVGKIDGDPLYNGQDFEIKKFVIGAAAVKAGSAKVNVTFTNFGEKQSIRFLLVKEGGVWKIDDIDYGVNGSLNDWLK